MINLNGNIFQLVDKDGDEYGLILTDNNLENTEKLFKQFMNDELTAINDNLPANDKFTEGELDEMAENLSADDFCTILQAHGFNAERVYVEEINP